MATYTTKTTTKVGRRRRGQFVMRPVVSSVISHYGWFSVGLLVVRLNSGDIWCYVGCDRHMWLSLCHVKSKGRWWNAKVKGKLDGVKLDGSVKRTIEAYIVKPKVKREVQMVNQVASDLTA